MKRLNTANLEYGDVKSLSYLHIVEVAVRHGFDPELREKFLNWVQEQIYEHMEYREREIDMVDDL